MTITFATGLFHRFRRAAFPLCLLGGLLAIGPSEARAGFVGYYAPPNFTLTNIGGGVDDDTGLSTANGSVVFPDLLTLVLTGTSDGSAVDGYTDLTIPAAGSGFFQFRYLFTTEDVPAVQYAGYLIGADFFPLADSDGMSGDVSVFVNSGDLIGFRAGGDGQGFPGVLTVTEFSAPVPEPGTLQLLLIASGAILAGRCYHRRIQQRR